MSNALKLLLVPIPATSETDVIGFRAIPGVLPQILRLPGESLPCMLERARQASTGRGVYILWPLVRTEGGRHAMAG